MAKASAKPTTTFTWGIAQMERKTADGVVYTAHYTVDAKDDTDTYSAGAYGSIGFEAPTENIIPFADLTKDLVISWTKAALAKGLGNENKVAEIDAALQARIDQQRTPTTAQGVPWG